MQSLTHDSRISSPSKRLFTGAGPSVRAIAVAIVASMFLAFGSFGQAEATPSTANWQSPIMVAAKYVKSLEPSMKLSTNQLAVLLTDLRARVQKAGPAAVQQLQSLSKTKTVAPKTVTPMVTYWNSTYWFNHWDVAVMAGLSAIAVVGILLTTGPISVAVAYGIVGGVLGIMATAFFSGYCAYYVPPQHRGGMYRC